jgi:hypothetical protein
MTERNERTESEWTGGLAPMPAYVTGEGDPYRPEMLLWLNAEGLVLGHAVGRPGELLGGACESLRNAIEQPMVGPPRSPKRVRVASPALADALRAGYPGLAVVCAPTPEFDAVLRAMRESMDPESDDEPSYLSPGVDPEAVAAFFRAAATLYRAKPWAIVPSDQSLISITLERFGLTDAVLSVIGQMGQSLGFVLFSCIEDYRTFVAASDAIEQGLEPTLPPHFALNFERKADLGAGLRAEIAEFGWDVAGPRAYPWLVPVDSDLLVRPLTADDLTIAEVVALALVRLLGEKRALLAAWNGGQAVTRSLRVAAHGGDVAVTLRVPHERTPDQTHDRLG